MNAVIRQQLMHFLGGDVLFGLKKHFQNFKTILELVYMLLIKEVFKVLFFFMMLEGPTDEGLPGYCGQPKTAIEHLGQTGQGIVILHHALLAYPQWPVWREIVGIADRELSSYPWDPTLGI